MPVLPVSLMDSLWQIFSAFLPEHADSHPLGCHRPRIRGRVVFEHLIPTLVLGCTYVQAASNRCSATTIRRRRDKWINVGVFEALERVALAAYDRLIGLELGDISVDGCITKAPCGGQAAGASPVDRGKSGTKRSLVTDAAGIPLAVVMAGANRHDSPLLGPTLARLARLGSLPPVTVHLDAGYDSAKTRALLTECGYRSVISPKGTPLGAGARWVVERTHPWHNQGFKKLARCTEKRLRVIDALISLTNTIIIVRKLLAHAWTHHRWDTRPTKKPA